MINKLKKAIESFNHPGIATSPIKLVKNSIPYYLSTNAKVPNPLTIYWSINSVCNLRCKMCDVGTANEEGTFFKTLRIDRKLHEIPIELFKSVVDEVKSTKPMMAINSTEPLMYKPIVEAVDYCSSLSIPVAITTGAYKLPELAKDLVKAGLTRLNVSIDGPEEVHNSIRGRKDVFQKAIEGIQVFDEESKRLQRRAEIYINCTITNLNYDKIKELFDSLKNVNYTNLNFVLMWYLSPGIVEKQNEKYENYKISVSCFDSHVNPQNVKTDILKEQLELVKSEPKVNFLFKKNSDWIDFYFKNHDEIFPSSPGCMASWFFTQILADGKVVVYTRCHTEPLGNIHNDKLLDIWNGDKMKNWRSFIKKEQTMPMCARCDLAY